MTTLRLPIGSFARRGIAAPRRGWIGVDFGSRAIKLAQVAWSNDAYRIVARWTLATPESDPAAQSPISVQAPAAAQLRAARKLFRGVDVAASLPMSVLALRTIDAPPGTLEETVCLIEQDLLNDLPDADGGVSFDFWEVPSRDARAPEGKRYSVLAAPRNTVMHFADALLKAGLDSRVFDGLPCALARAVQLAEGPASMEPSAVIDLGFSSPLFVVVIDGQPVFVRPLRGCDMQSFTRPLCAGLDINLAQAEQLLGRFGVASSGRSEATAAEIATHRLAAEPMDALISELQRTLGYLSQQLREQVPRRMWVLGGGAAWPGMAERLAEKLDLPVHPWKLPGLAPATDRSDALFGVAAALSSLANGGTACT